MWNDIKPKHMDKHKPIVLEMNLKVVDIKFIDIQQIVMEKLKMNIAMFNNMPRNLLNHQLMKQKPNMPKLIYMDMEMLNQNEEIENIKPKHIEMNKLIDMLPKDMKPIVKLKFIVLRIMFENEKAMCKPNMPKLMFDMNNEPKMNIMLNKQLCIVKQNLVKVIVKDKPHTNICTHKASTIVKYSPLLRNIRFAPFSKYNVSG